MERAAACAIERTLDRAGLEAAISHELGSLGACMDGLLARLGIGREQIGLVFLTGGTSQIPCIHQLFEDRFPGRIVARDAFTAVGTGLGV